MTQPTSDSPHAPTSVQVLVRFGLRLVILAAFASFSSQGFGKSWTGLLALAAIFCAVTAALRREEVLAPVLSHWDEAAAFAFANCFVSHLA